MQIEMATDAYHTVPEVSRQRSLAGRLPRTRKGKRYGVDIVHAISVPFSKVAVNRLHIRQAPLE